MEKISYISARYLEPDPLVKREGYDQVMKERLFEDIKEHGFKSEHPLVVRPNLKKRGYWLIVSGQHRFEVGQRAGVATFPCIKKEYEDSVLILADAYKDNALYCPVDAITEAKYFDSLGREILKRRGKTDESIEKLRRKYPHERIALQVGVKRDYVIHRLKLLRLPPFVQWMVKRYYQSSQRGHKLSPTIAEELVRIMDLLKAQNVSNYSKRPMTDLAVRFWKNKTTLHEARIIAAEIAYQGYENWKDNNDKKVVMDNKGVRCAKCGVKLDKEDFPWVPLCPTHKHEILGHDANSVNAINIYNSKGATKPITPYTPLHEIDPETHKPKRPDREKDQDKEATG